MTDPPIFSKLDADRILRRAAEIEGAADGGRLSVDELRSIAGEAGFGAAAVERAIAEARAAPPPEIRRPPVQKWGLLRTHLTTFREIPVEVGTDQLMNAVRLFQPYRDGPAQVKLEEREITWRDRRGLQFALTSNGGVTEIRVYVSKFLLRKGRWMGWVKAAADRLETLVLMSAQDQRGPEGFLPVVGGGEG
ncbi:MAG: hypothetical protein RJQ04_20295 [Longimicrobiales bacterium]